MTAVFTLKKGSTIPRLRMQLRDAKGVPVDLTAALSVAFRMRTAAAVSLKVNAAAQIITPLLGIVEYVWQPGDVDTVGEYLAEWVIAFTAGAEIAPSLTFVIVNVVNSLA